MKSVKGFQSDDGTFFESSAECELYEAELALDKVCESHGVDPTKYKQMVRAATLLTLRYINAYEAVEAENETRISADEERRDETVIGDAEHTITEDINEGVQQLPFSRDEHMRPVGDSEQSKIVSRGEPRVRIRGREPDA